MGHTQAWRIYNKKLTAKQLALVPKSNTIPANQNQGAVHGKQPHLSKLQSKECWDLLQGLQISEKGFLLQKIPPPLHFPFFFLNFLLLVFLVIYRRSMWNWSNVRVIFGEFRLNFLGRSVAPMTLFHYLVDNWISGHIHLPWQYIVCGDVALTLIFWQELRKKSHFETIQEKEKNNWQKDGKKER